MDRCGSRPGASRTAMWSTPPRLGWAFAWARAGPAAMSEPRSSELRKTAASSRRVVKGARRAMARSPVLEKDVVIDREKERRGPKSWPIILGRGGLSMSEALGGLLLGVVILLALAVWSI